MKIYIGTDHRGFELKNKLYGYLSEKKVEVIDYGAYEHDPDDDYTLYAEKVGSVVADNSKDLGILLCGSGVGVDVTANKLDGVRASIGKEVKQVVAGRKDDNMNVLVIASDFTTFPQAKKLVDAFLSTKYDHKKRHDRRLEDIRRIEENN
ncbi:RpiB/LacA/LacB family sugar-phosphate isomerase [Patescibacteria group bacterium]